MVQHFKKSVRAFLAVAILSELVLKAYNSRVITSFLANEACNLLKESMEKDPAEELQLLAWTAQCIYLLHLFYCLLESSDRYLGDAETCR